MCKPELRYRLLFLLCLLVMLPLYVAADAHDGFSGPLRGRNTYLPFRLFLHTPAMPSAAMSKGTLETDYRLYYTNDFHSYVSYSGNMEDHYRISDFENILFETMLQYQASGSLSVIGLFRITSYYGGWMDRPIEGFHHLFGFRNAGREHFPVNDISIDIENDNGMNITSNNSETAVEDIDLWLRFTLPHRFSRIDSALWAGVKLPAGGLWGSSIISTGYPDLGILLSADLLLFPFLTLYLQGGATVPLNSLFTGGDEQPYPFFNGLFGLEWTVYRGWSVLGQMNIKTRVLSGGIDHWYFSDIDRMSLPQTNLLFGAVYKTERARWQFYFEEDFLTHQGADITIGVQYSRQFSLD